MLSPEYPCALTAHLLFDADHLMMHPACKKCCNFAQEQLGKESYLNKS